MNCRSWRQAILKRYWTPKRVEFAGLRPISPEQVANPTSSSCTGHDSIATKGSDGAPVMASTPRGQSGPVRNGRTADMCAFASQRHQERSGRLLLPRRAYKFKERCAMFGSNDAANLDNGAMRPVAHTLTELTAAEEARIGARKESAGRGLSLTDPRLGAGPGRSGVGRPRRGHTLRCECPLLRWPGPPAKKWLA